MNIAHEIPPPPLPSLSKRIASMEKGGAFRADNQINVVRMTASRVKARYPERTYIVADQGDGVWIWRTA